MKDLLRRRRVVSRRHANRPKEIPGTDGETRPQEARQQARTEDLQPGISTGTAAPESKEPEPVRSAQYAVRSTQCAVRSTQYAVRSNAVTQYAVRSNAVRSAQYAVRSNTVRSTQYAVRRTQYAVRSSQYAVRSAQHAVRSNALTQYALTQ